MKASALHSQVYLKPFEQHLRLTPRSARIRRDILEHKPFDFLSTLPALPKLPGNLVVKPQPQTNTHKKQASLSYNVNFGCVRELRNEFKLLIRPRKSISLRKLPKDLYANGPGFNWKTAAKLLASKEVLYLEHIRDTYAGVYRQRRSEEA